MPICPPPEAPADGCWARAARALAHSTQLSALWGCWGQLSPSHSCCCRDITAKVRSPSARGRAASNGGQGHGRRSCHLWMAQLTMVTGMETEPHLTGVFRTGWQRVARFVRSTGRFVSSQCACVCGARVSFLPEDGGPRRRPPTSGIRRRKNGGPGPGCPRARWVVLELGEGRLSPEAEHSGRTGVDDSPTEALPAWPGHILSTEARGPGILGVWEEAAWVSFSAN